MASLMATLAIGVISSTQVSAHTVSEWMGKYWPSSDRNAEWQFTSRVPTGAFRERVKDAAYTWNVQGQTLQFQHVSGDLPVGPSWCDSTPVSYVDYMEFSAHAAAGTCSMYEAGVGAWDNMIVSFQIAIDVSNPNYANNGAWWVSTWPASDNSRDLQGIATHEFGHVTGRCCLDEMGLATPAGGDSSSHYVAGAGLCPADSVGRHTMCAGSTAIESFYKRSLETHDIDVFNAKY